MENTNSTCTKGNVDFGPYLYDLQSDSVYVMAVTSAQNDTFSIILKDNNDNVIGTYAENEGILNRMSEYVSYGLRIRYTYKVLISNLHANTTYKYDAVICGVNYNNNTFKTPPLHEDNTTEFTFGIWGDTQDVPLCKKAATEILEFLPLVMIHVGDFLNEGKNPNEINKYLFGPAAKLLRNTAIIPVAGNHDMGAKYWEDIFPVPRNNTTPYSGNLYFTYDIGNVHIVNIHIWKGERWELDDNHLYSRDTDPVTGDRARIIKMLEEDAASPAASAAKYRIIAMHTPPLANPDWEFLIPYLKKYDPSMIFFGHKHNFKYSLARGTEFKAIVTGLLWDGYTYPEKDTSYVEATVNYYDKATNKNTLKFTPYVWDGSSDAETGSFSVRPGDIIINPPAIVNPPIVTVADTSVTITWETDVATDERIDFGTDRYLSNSIVIQADISTNHKVTINNLIPDTKYLYRVKGMGENGDIGRTDILKFATIQKQL